MVFGNLGRMAAAAAGERDGSILAAVFESGCGGGIWTLDSWVVSYEGRIPDGARSTGAKVCRMVAGMPKWFDIVTKVAR